MVKPAHITFEDDSRVLDLVGDTQGINLEEKTGLTEEEEQTVDQDKVVEKTKEEMKDERSKETNERKTKEE